MKNMQIRRNQDPWEPTFPSFLGGITHILGVENLHFSWFWGPRDDTISWRKLFKTFPKKFSLRIGNDTGINNNVSYGTNDPLSNQIANMKH